MRPMPPEHLQSPTGFGVFSPATGLDEWVRAMFIDDGAELENEAHAHLRSAELGWVWTNMPIVKQGRAIIGQCELVMDSGGTWARGRSLHQLRTWFGGIPDFVITLLAPVWVMMDDRNAFALIEHELMHAAHARDQYGNPKYSRDTGLPVFGMRGHDFEEFVGVVERYGATSPALRTAAEAIMAGPLFSDDDIRIACGTCAAR